MRWNSDLYRHQCVRPIPIEVLADKMVLFNELTQWEHAIQPLMTSLEHQHNHDKLTLMRIHNRTGLTLLESSLHIEECLLDTYHWAFEDTVNYTAELQERPYGSDDESSESDASMTPEPSSLTTSTLLPSPPARSRVLRTRARPFFLLDNGVIFSLYWAALKSRDGVLRRRAISLLSTSTQEGVWIGPIQAAIAKRVVEIEEGQPYEQSPPPERIKRAGDVPEFVRVHSVGTDIDKVGRRAKMVVLQRCSGVEGEWSERVEWVSW